jgi:hypothetical protein
MPGKSTGDKMSEAAHRARPYALQAGEGWTYRFGIDFTIKASEVQAGSSAAILEYVTVHREEPPDPYQATCVRACTIS